MAKLTNLRPMLACNDIAETIAFYTERLGFALEGSFGEDPAKPTWCQVGRDGVGLMFTFSEAHTHDDGSVHEAEKPALAGGIYINVDSADELFEELKPKVDAFEWEPETMVYGMREFAVRDCNGYLLLFGNPTEEG